MITLEEAFKKFLHRLELTANEQKDVTNRHTRIREIVRAGIRHRKPVNLCGEMAGRPVEAMALLGIGLRSISMTPAAIGPVKALVDRPRPPGSLIATTGASYPSGHAIASAVTAIGGCPCATGSAVAAEVGAVVSACAT